MRKEEDQTYKIQRNNTITDTAPTIAMTYNVFQKTSRASLPAQSPSSKDGGRFATYCAAKPAAKILSSVSCVAESRHVQRYGFSDFSVEKMAPKKTHRDVKTLARGRMVQKAKSISKSGLKPLERKAMVATSMAMIWSREARRADQGRHAVLDVIEGMRLRIES